MSHCRPPSRRHRSPPHVRHPVRQAILLSMVGMYYANNRLEHANLLLKKTPITKDGA
uniref:Uncharacterized protein n=1 Tax=Oryza meridionalis TaxID=40149 RepID=A0A0E0F3I9_9ORYZ